MRRYLCGIAQFVCLLLLIGNTSATSAGTDHATDLPTFLTLDGKLRTVSYDVYNTQTDRRSGAWTTALWLNGQTSNLTDIFYLGASFFGVSRLEMAKNSSTSNQLLNDANEGFAKLGQAYMRIATPASSADHGGASFTLGRQILKTGLISGSSSRSVPSSWRGYNLKMASGNLEAGVALVDRMSLRSQAGFHRLINFSGQTIDHIIGGELFYRVPLSSDRELLLKYRNGFSRDFIQAHNLDAQLISPIGRGLEFTLGTRLYHAKKAGDFWHGTGWSGSPLFDDHASVVNIHGTLTSPAGWSLNAAASHYHARSSVIKRSVTGYAPPGAYYYDMGANTHGFWNISTNGFAEDMMYDGETVMMAGISYDFSVSGIQGLSGGYAFHYGSGMKVTTPDNRQDRVSEYEHDLFVIWRFPQPFPKGLTFKLKFGLYRNDHQLRQAIRKEENDLRIWLDYDFLAF